MKTIKLFTDGSVHPQSKTGVAAFLVLDNDDTDLDTLSLQIQTKTFFDTSSTRLELQGLLWALENLAKSIDSVMVYTDCQNIIKLLDRREKLEENNFTNKQGKFLNNHDLYRLFYKQLDNLDCHFIKIKGHKQQKLKDNIDKIFALVDKQARNTLRNQYILTQ